MKAAEQAGPGSGAGEWKFDTQRGRPLPLGAWPIAGGVNFALFSRHASAVELLLYRAATGAEPVAIELKPDEHRTGDIWHIWVRGLAPGDCYAYRVDGPYRPEEGLRFNRERILIDPYARALRIPLSWDFSHAHSYDPALPQNLAERDNSPFAAHGIVVPDQFFSSAPATLVEAWSRTIIYETHVRGLTMDPSSTVASPGTYLGLIEKLPYLQKLGITTIELLPVQEFNPNEHSRINPLTGARLSNYWGYNPVAFLAPASCYAKTPAPGHLEEFHNMVVEAHRAGIEVILDVVFNHTAEGDEGGPTLSFRGLDNPIYYLLEEDLRHYLNYAGTGNTLNCNHPVVRELILDCLRQWTISRGVDGFRFDLASILGRDRNGHLASNPPLLEAIAEDPILSSVKLIAEAWDAGGAYQLGSFSDHRWSEWNGRFRDDVRRFWRGDPGMAGAFASRLCGSADIYQRYGKQPLNSINFVTCHDGMTLNDLVSYSHKHNDANGEDNQDGAGDDYSYNYGVEGPTQDPEINRTRLRQAKNLMATLMLSRGVPMILGGDEFLRTQRGNNNAYCQDNEISWYDWQLLERNREFYEFTRRIIAFRTNHPVLCAERFYTSDEVIWFNPSGASPNWSAPENRLGCVVSADGAADSILAMMFNAERDVAGFRLPPSAAGAGWRVVIDTAAAAPGDVQDFTSAPHLEATTVAVTARSLIVLEAQKLG
ncbi:MAG TPA: glycogen debranching protein GlgX [Candidatus Binataceae bacterium]|nr:glycogen debranching protein GlgX [Candidatus Binataceae bacterium]